MRGPAVKSRRHAIIATRDLEGPDEGYSPLVSETAITPPLLPRQLSLCTSVGEANRRATRSKILHDSRQVPAHDEQSKRVRARCFPRGSPGVSRSLRQSE